jgi:acid phosphatase (class A)
MTSKYHRTLPAFVVLLTLLGGAPASAEDAACFEPHVPVQALLLPPPQQGSAETMAELRELQRLQHSRTLHQAEYAKADYKRSVGRFLGAIGITLKNLPPFSKDFFNCVFKATEDEVSGAKTEFRRTRPYKLPNNHLRPLKKIGKDDSYSYPSGHATYGMVVGLILARMLPEKKGAIFARIEDFGHSRLVSGVHFRSDVYAGEVAGGAIAVALFENQAFCKSFERAKTELREAAGY